MSLFPLYLYVRMLAGHPYLISLTFSGKILLHSLPLLREVTMIQYESLYDFSYLPNSSIGCADNAIQAKMLRYACM